MPRFWEEYDRGMTSYDEVVSQLAEYNSCDRELAQKNLRRSIITQEEIPSTKRLIEQLKETGYRLYVLSNMSLEFIEFLHTKNVYNNFEGEVVSCYEHVVKPDVKIYNILTERYGLDQAETLFIDDRAKNVDTAIMLGWQGYHFDPRNPDKSCEELCKMLL